ncbi:alkaline phosphatase family protein [Geminicoccaceae bacterium 1502E]|nr:alkaline phosphatase family protein [Geminicoccaceae bacterium 1502E]
MTAGPVLLIGMDAAEIAITERLMDSGRMPNLAALVAGGTSGSLVQRPTGLSAMVWPKWFEGGAAARWYFPKLWNPERMRLEWVTAASGAPRPFWEDLAGRGLRCAVFDVPQAPVREPGGDGLVVQGWQVHDLFERRTAPQRSWRRLAGRFGPPPLGPEAYGRRTAAELLQLREQALAATRQMGAIGEAMLSEESWDLFVLVFGAMHRAGHYLWDLGQLDQAMLGGEEKALLRSALDEVYEEADKALGRMLEAAPAGSRVMVFALHGMGPNNGWSERFQQIAGQAEATKAAGPRRPTALQRLKGVLPRSMVQRIMSSLPESSQRHLVPFLSRRLHDWSGTRWFALPSDLNGFLRVNLQGREAQGIVEPGPAFEALCEELCESFLRLEEVETGAPVVRAVERTDDFVPPDDPARPFLPDLLVNWQELATTSTAGVRFPSGGQVRWHRGERFLSGRSGNHRPIGWFAASGPGIAPGVIDGVHEIADMVPTVYHWLGQDAPASFRGRPIETLLPQRRALSIEREVMAGV